MHQREDAASFLFEVQVANPTPVGHSHRELLREPSREPLMDERVVLEAIALLAVRSPLMETLQECIRGYRRLEKGPSFLGTQIQIGFHGGRGEHSREHVRPRCKVLIDP